MAFYTAKELRPQGWLRRQLEIQAEGLSGNLDKVWRDSGTVRGSAGLPRAGSGSPTGWTASFPSLICWITRT